MPGIMASPQTFIHRDTQQKQLIGLFGDATHHSIPCIFVYGQKSCGKTSLVSHILNTQQCPHVFVNCIECYAQTLLFENVLRGIDACLHNNDITPAMTSSAVKCDNGNDFVRQLKSRLEGHKETFYLVLDKAEYLRDLDDLLLPLVVNLQALTGSNLCVLLISELPWEKFHGEIAIRRPYMIFFSDYTNSQLMDLLCHTRATLDVDESFYRNYIHIVVNVFSLTCRDLRELQYLANVNFWQYCKPVEEGKVKKDDYRRLWKNIEPRLKQALQNIYFRSDFTNEIPSTSSSTTAVTQKSSLLVELPFYTKFLLISAYIASFNPASSDKRFFMKNAGRMRKRVKNANVVKSTKVNCHLQGPHSFPLNRMMAIFYSIIDGRVRPTVNLFSQVTNLVSLQLMARISREDEIDSPKYKCLASMGTVTAISKTVDFEISKYLYDLV